MGLQFDLIALDVDGTLLTDHHELTAETRDAVRQAAERDAEIVLCTGRGPGSALPILEELGLGGTIITHNGAATIDAGARTVLHQYDLASEYLEEVLAYCRKHAVHFDVNTAMEMFVQGMTPEAERMYNQFLISPTRLNEAAPLPLELVKFTAFGTKDVMDKVQEDWKGLPSALQPIRSGDFFIDLQHPEASKGTALKQLVALRGIERNRIMAIGNYYNDISMLEFAGLGIAMDNSPQAVKDAADAVCPSNEDNGVAHALRQYILD